MALGSGLVDWEDVIRNARKGVEGGLDKIGTEDGDIAMENLLKDFGIADESFEQALRIGL